MSTLYSAAIWRRQRICKSFGWIWSDLTRKTPRSQEEGEEIFRFTVTKGKTLFVIPPNDNVNPKVLEQVRAREKFYDDYYQKTGIPWLSKVGRVPPVTHMWPAGLPLSPPPFFSTPFFSPFLPAFASTPCIAPSVDFPPFARPYQLSPPSHWPENTRLITRMDPSTSPHSPLQATNPLFNFFQKTKQLIRRFRRPNPHGFKQPYPMEMYSRRTQR